LIILAILLFSRTADPAVLYFSIGNQQYQKRLLSVKELKEKEVLLQTDELTCGVAALATLLSRYGDDTVTEEDLLSLERDLVKGRGISLLQLKQLAEKRGFVAEGYQMDLVNLFDEKRPMLLHVVTRLGGHYVVFDGLYKDRIYLSDPAVGKVRMSLEEFAQIFSGAVLVVGSRKQTPLVNLFEPPEFAQPELNAVKYRFKR